MRHGNLAALQERAIRIALNTATGPNIGRLLAHFPEFPDTL